MTFCAKQLGAVLLVMIWLLHASSAVAQSFEKPVLHKQSMHTQAAGTVVYSRSGKNLFASGSEDATIKLYEATTGREIRTLVGHEKQVYQVAISSDGEMLASASEDGTARLWKISTGQLVHTLREHGGPVTSVAFNSNGSLLASGGWDNNARVWNVTTGKEVHTLTGHTGYVTAVAFSSTDSDLLATGSADSEIRLWNARTGQLLHTLKGHEGTVNALAFNPGGDLLASGGSDYTVRLWDLKTNSSRGILSGHAYAVTSLSFSPDGLTLASSSEDATIRLWSIETRQTRSIINAHKIKAYAVDFSPDGERLISSGADETIKIWDVARETVLLDLELRSAPEKQIAISRDGKKLATATLNEISLQTVGEGQEAVMLRGHSSFVTAVAFSEDSELLASASEDGAVKLWNVRSGRESFSLAGDGSKVHRLAFSPDGKSLATQDDNDVVRLWNLQTHTETLRLANHPSSVTSLAFTRGGETLACGYWNGDIKLWNTTNGNLKLWIQAAKFSSPIAAIAFNNDGKMFATGEWVTPKVALRDAASGRLLHEFRQPSSNGESPPFSHDDDILKVSFSDDGKRIISCSRDKSVKVWSVDTKRQLAVFKGHSSAVKEARLIADGSAVLSGAADGEFIIWRVNDAVELARLVQVDNNDWLAVTPDGLFDGSPAAWNQLLWRFNQNTFDFAPVEAFYNEFFYPGLLKDILDGEHPKAPRNFAALDRRQPQIKVTATTEVVRSRTTSVRVEITEAAADTTKGLPAGEVRDIRLFRNGSLVYIWRGRTMAELKQQPGCEILPAEKSLGRKLICQTTIAITAGPNRLTAYAFNRDDVKSNDAETLVQGDESLKRKGTLYVLAIGIDRYTDQTRNLRFAVADIKDIGASLEKQHANTKIIELTDDDATKANLMLALRRFRDASSTLPSDLSEKAHDELAKIETAKPEDVLLIYFSGHGAARCESSSCDRFYLIPHDGFPAAELSDNERLAQIYQHSISDLELESALEPIDVGKVLLIIDACKSGQLLYSEEKRRGPMNSKGLAQLAYEKGMYVLAATQSDKFALEVFRLGDKEIKHGLLTYILLEGLTDRRANTNDDSVLTEREWFNYAVAQLPSLQLVKMQGCRDVDVDCPAVSGEENVSNLRSRTLQVPRIFYRREADPFPLIIRATP